MVAIKERIEILGGVPLFESLSKHQMRKLANLVKEVEHPVGHVVVEEGQVGVGFHIILSGRVKVTVGGRTRRYMEAGAYFGELALVDRGPRSATVTVSEQSTMLYLPGLDFRKLLLGDAALCYKLLVQVSQRLRDAEKSRTS
jgi:CRP-like cAMP-binding protein